MVAEENHYAARQAGLIEQHGKHLDCLGRPGNVDLVALEQMVVHGVDHHAHDPAAGLFDLAEHAGRQHGIVRSLEGVFVEQDRRHAATAVLQQRRMLGETVLLVRGLPLPQFAAEQAGPADLGYRGQRGCDAGPNRVRCPFGADLHPVLLRNAHEKFPYDGEVHAVNHQHEHRGVFGQRGDHFVQNPLYRQHLGGGTRYSGSSTGCRPVAKQLAEPLVLLFPGLHHFRQQPRIGIGKFVNRFSSAERVPSPIDEAASQGLFLCRRGKGGRRRGPGSRVRSRNRWLMARMLTEREMPPSSPSDLL